MRESCRCHIHRHGGTLRHLEESVAVFPGGSGVGDGLVETKLSGVTGVFHHPVAVVPPKWADVLDRIALRLQSLPTEDADAFVPMCYRCGAPSPPLTASVEAISRHGIRPAAARLDLSHARDNARANDDGAAGTPPLGIPAAGAFGGDACPRCGHAVVRSSLNFEPLPLVEFVPEEGVEPDEALQLLAEDTINGAVAVGRGGLEGEERGSDGRGWREIHTDAGQRLVLDAQDDASALFLSDPEHAAPASSSKSGDDLFNDCVTASMNASVNPQQRARSPSDSLSLDAVSSHMINGHSHAGTAPGLVSNRPVVLPRAVLRVQNPAHVFVVRALLPSQSDGSGPPTATSSSGAALSARSTTALLGGQQSAMAAPASAWELADPHFRPRYFKNVIPDVAISMCAFCCRFFHQVGCGEYGVWAIVLRTCVALLKTVNLIRSIVRCIWASAYSRSLQYTHRLALVPSFYPLAISSAGGLSVRSVEARRVPVL